MLKVKTKGHKAYTNSVMYMQDNINTSARRNTVMIKSNMSIIMPQHYEHRDFTKFMLEKHTLNEIALQAIFFKILNLNFSICFQLSMIF